MKRKVITYFLLSVFLFSIIGVPIAIHYCQMMNSVSLQACEICENSTSNCCKDEETETTVVSYQNDSCCNTKIIADPLTEKYISAFYELQKADFKTFEYILPSKTLFSENVTTTNFVSDNSPSSIYSNSIYLDNSLLLI